MYLDSVGEPELGKIYNYWTSNISLIIVCTSIIQYTRIENLSSLFPIVLFHAASSVNQLR